MIHITDGKTDVILDVIDESEFWNDKHTKSLKDALETFDFTTFADKRFSRYLAERNRIVIPDEDGEYIEFVIENTRKFRGDNGLFVEVYTSASYIELAKAKVIDPQTTPSWTARQHADFALSGTEFTVGRVDFVGSRSITFESYTNPYAYLKRAANELGLELHFRIETDGIKVTRRYVDLIERIGGWNGREVEFGKDLMGIERREDFSNIATALVGVSPERSDGTRLEVFVEDKEALARWGRNGRHIIDIYEPDSSDNNMTIERLRELTEEELERRVNSVVDYKCDVADLEKVPGLEHERFRFGDTIRIKDTSFEPPLYLEASIHTIERSIKRDGQKIVTLGDYIEYTEEDVFAIYKQLKAVLAEHINVESLSAISANLGTVTAGEMIGVVIKTSPSAETEGIVLSGTQFRSNSMTYGYYLTIGDGYIMTSSSNNYTLEMHPDSIRFRRYTASGGSVSYYEPVDSSFGELFIRSRDYITIEASEVRTPNVETGFCGVGGMTTGVWGPVAGVGVNFRMKKTYTPSSVSLSGTSNNLVYSTHLHAIDISQYGFWLYINGGSTRNAYRYWRGYYVA